MMAWFRTGDINHVEVQTNSRFVKVGGGATFGEVDAQPSPQRLVIPGGVISSLVLVGLPLVVAWVISAVNMA